MALVKVSDEAYPSISALNGLSTRKLLEIDSETFRASFNRTPFYIKHHLLDHPLFSLPRLVELSRKLPAKQVIYHSGEIKPDTTLYGGASTGLSSEETIRQIENCRSWMVLRYVEKDPEYREFLDQCLDEIQTHTEPIDPGMLMRQAFIFITSPLAVTPWHTDPEYSFLLQIRGTKTLKIISPSPLSEEELEKYFAYTTNPEFKDEYYRMASTYELSEGQGLHFPLGVPHWVYNGDAVSISISITFQTRASDRRTLVYKTNNYLRKQGLRPRPYGQSYIADMAKFYAYRATRRAKRLLGASKVEGPQRY